MPLISIESNQDFDRTNRSELDLNRKASKLISDMLGKSENYVMVSFRHNPHMLFGGSDQPLAYVELKSLGLPEDQTSSFTEALCGLLNSELNIPSNRIYIEFVSGPRHLWGWNNKTF